MWLASGCAGLVVTAPETPPPAPRFEERELSLENGFLHVRIRIPHEPRERKPVVIGSLGDDEALLARGAILVAFRNRWKALGNLRDRFGPEGPAEADRPAEPSPPEASERQQRVGRWMLAAPRAGVVGRGYFDVIGVSANASIPRILDYLEALPEVDPERIAVAGSSTRGFVALEALVRDERLAGGAVRVTCGDYHEFLRSSSLALAGEERHLVDGELVLDPDYEATLREREPIRFAERFPPRPLLMLNGRRDPAIPFACAQRTARALRDAYARAGTPERFRFVVYDEAGHDLGRGADEEILRWWESWLLTPPAPP